MSRNGGDFAEYIKSVHDGVCKQIVHRNLKYKEATILIIEMLSLMKEIWFGSAKERFDTGIW